ncbi:exodeoxyribonuclease V subunit alpha [Lysobacter solisilvae (ex Woo and Kim 2020)]|uniref:RecBCD enzyme subunit RecD n=1 Tax=Agrilutibacter terrestris TaxID=2865112 RepID=A0A7H0FTN8_9GAMM|nr:exodeoxyribonuclease V subunit alpha [Lysobacter terrestris]QNP39404.1 exodeoxyribonuclease V subunit alpha [Lysobacter terrestris]
MSLLDLLYRHGALRTVDHALAQSLRRLDPDTPDAVLAAAALASNAIALGHAGVDLTRPPEVADANWPEPAAWRAALHASGWVATPDAREPAAAETPLVLEGDLLYLRRYREYERRLAAHLQRLAAQTPAGAMAADAVPEALFDALFPQRDHAQARAARLALQSALLVITGGPGTGKTTTIARLLVLLLAQARAQGRRAPRIALAAPTGRAAERMAQSLRKAIAQLQELAELDPTLCAALPQQARTLHRLLGTVPGRPRFRHDADHPLPFDAIVVDEASMVDLPLMCKLVEAVPDGARLILLGDPDQLPSVEAGDVLAAIVAAAGEETVAAKPAAVPAAAATEPARRARAPVADPAQTDLFGAAPVLAPTPSTPPSDVPATESPRLPRVHLTRGYRQADSLDLGPLASAARDGEANELLALLRGGRLSGVHFHDGLADPLVADTRVPLLAPWRALAGIEDPATALALADRARVLTALREGPQGAFQLNARIEEALAGAQRERYFHGRLLLVTENSYRHGLFNGDIGVCLRGDGGAIVAWFAATGGGVRGFHPAALPAHGGAFAMTVHKAQGSEYDTVWLQLPRQDVRTLSRELVYTALTRARQAVHVCGSDAVLAAALARHAQRVSGLARRLRTAR